MVEDAITFFPGAAIFEWHSRKAFQIAHREPVPAGVQAAMVASWGNQITSTYEDFAVKLNLVAHL